MDTNGDRRFPRIRFRTSSLLWLTVVVAAFFCGRRSPEIQVLAAEWWKVTRVRWGAAVSNCEVVSGPPGSVTINEVSSVRPFTLIAKDPSVASVALTAANQVRVSPTAEGKTTVSYKLAGGTYLNGEMEIEVLNGIVTMDWSLTHK